SVYDIAEDNEICAGGLTILHSEVVGGAGDNVYQWQQFVSGTWVDIFGANGADYVTDILDEGSYEYRVVVTQDAGCEGASDGEIIIVNADPIVYDSAEDNEICDGGLTVLHSEVVGGAGDNTYQWQQLVSGSWVDIFGANGADYVTETLATGSYTYRVVVIQDSGCEAAADGEVIVVNADPLVYDTALDNEICGGGSTTLESEVIGGAGSNTYQWQQLISGTWVDIFGANASSYTTEILDVGSYTYRVVVIQDSGCENAGDGETIEVLDDPQVYDIADDNEICAGGTTTMYSEVIGGSGANSYQWQQNVEGSWVDIFGANGPEYTTEVLDEGVYEYRIVVTQDSGCESASDGEIIVVNADPSVYDIAEDNEICAGGLTILHSEVVGGAGDNVYQWQQFVSGT
ncbi:MAG: hypothetical protein LC650_03500, partial [Actinobacteria bacterium]|nr:hypothetical protein [Actinomycetota bacterium]